MQAQRTIISERDLMNAARRDSSGSIVNRPTIGNGQLWAMRVIRSDFGVVVVYESDRTAPPPAARVLVFESFTGKVELTSYPAEWRKLSDAELMLLSYGRIDPG